MNIDLKWRDVATWIAYAAFVVCMIAAAWIANPHDPLCAVILFLCGFACYAFAVWIMNPWNLR